MFFIVGVLAIPPPAGCGVWTTYFWHKIPTFLWECFTSFKCRLTGVLTFIFGPQLMASSSREVNTVSFTVILFALLEKCKFQRILQRRFQTIATIVSAESLHLQTTLFCKSRCALIRGRDIHEYETRGRDSYRTERHRTVAYEHLTSQAGVHLINRLPDSIKNAPTPKALKIRLKHFLAPKAFYNVGEFMAHNWETDHLQY
ncbi:hypothetical protein J6590_057365 [Homalodisca vitripennis]|nr:hypothetical protein J6590_057365 [Homalodisca vitripennis]